MRRVIMLMAAGLMSACTQYPSVEKPKDDPQLQAILNQVPTGVDSSASAGALSAMSDSLALLEVSIRDFFAVAKREWRLQKYEVKVSDYHRIKALVAQLPNTQRELVRFTANPELNPGGRFTAAISPVAGAIGDVERNLIGIYNDPNDFYGWIVETEALEDARRLYYQLQILRADLVNHANTNGRK